MTNDKVFWFPYFVHVKKYLSENTEHHDHICTCATLILGHLAGLQHNVYKDGNFFRQAKHISEYVNVHIKNTRRCIKILEDNKFIKVNCFSKIFYK